MELPKVGFSPPNFTHFISPQHRSHPLGIRFGQRGLRAGRKHCTSSAVRMGHDMHVVLQPLRLICYAPASVPWYGITSRT